MNAIPDLGSCSKNPPANDDGTAYVRFMDEYAPIKERMFVDLPFGEGTGRDEIEYHPTAVVQQSASSSSVGRGDTRIMEQRGE